MTAHDRRIRHTQARQRGDDKITVRPVHYDLTRSQYLFSVMSIASAFALLIVYAARLAARVDLLNWWMPVAFAGGVAAADFASGIVHWGADTWGREDLPLIGRRLLVPFRVHHVNPEDFLRRSFVDTNGDVAGVAVPVLAALVNVPLGAGWDGVAMFGFGFCGVGVLTNQIHQWAHMPAPPRLVQVAQSLGIVLGRVDHAVHHQQPHDAHYCITTGWCNRPLERIRFFRRLESAVTLFTGQRPREDDRRHIAVYG